MKDNFKQCLAPVLAHEGDFVNHPNDPGGATNKGVTIGPFRAHVMKNGTVAVSKIKNTVGGINNFTLPTVLLGMIRETN